MPNPFARCMAVAGNKTAGSILYRLAYWMKKTKIRRGPHHWVVMTRDEWMAETACTLDEYKRGLSRLKSLGLVEVSHHLWKGQRTAFIRLTDQAQKCINAPTDWCKIAPTGGCGIAPTNKEPTVLSSEIKKGDTLVSGELPPAGDTEATVKVSEVVAAMAAKKHLHKPDTTKQLEFVWKETFAEVYDQGLVHLTGKQLGQLKHFLGKCPPGKAATILEWAIRNWVEFVKDVETKAGIKTTPSYPSIDFLLKHAWVAVDLASSPTKKAPIPKQQEAATGVLSGETVQLISQDDDQPKTLEELMAILGDKPKE